MKYVITEIGERDAHYPHNKEWSGTLVGDFLEIPTWSDGEWKAGELISDVPVYLNGEMLETGIYFIFAYVKVEKIREEDW